jgi:succinate dehydrogenase/fumarate reductase flavoprotein subunit
MEVWSMNTETEHIETDVLVLGGGMTGYRAALAARATGARVTMAYRARGASPYVIGFNAPLGAMDDRDTPQVYFDDMVRGGYGLNDRRLVRVLADNAVPAFEELSRLGVPFAHKPSENGAAPTLLQRHLSGNTYPRSVFIPEGTGAGIMTALHAAARAADIQIVAGQKVVELLRDGEEVVGALLWREHPHTLTAIRARSVVMAMGGIGRLYADSTYPADVGADAFGFAFDAGADLIDMEFVQFEPVVTVWPSGCRGMEMPTAMLGDGAHLINRLGERFMLGYNPPLGERGIEKARMSLFIQREIDEGRGFPEGGVTFDTTVLTSAALESYVSHCKRLRAAGVDPATTPPLVAPAAHSMMGGVAVDEWGWSGVAGLYVGGEAAGGVHGASRIAGNGCSDTLVFGAVAGEGAARGMLPNKARDWDAIEAHAQRLLVADSPDESAAVAALEASDIDAIKDRIRQTLSLAAGIWRSEASLADGRIQLDAIAASIGTARAGNFSETVQLREARRMVQVGRMIIGAALARTESRGAHQRTDFPDLDDAVWLRHVTFRRAADGALAQEFTAIR